MRPPACLILLAILALDTGSAALPQSSGPAISPGVVAAWPQFRGLRGGVGEDHPALPDRWSEAENVIWKVDVPGLSWSSPIVWGDHVIVTSAIGEERATPPKGFFNPSPSSAVTPDIVHRWVVLDFDVVTGRLRWQTELHSARPRISKQLKNSYASETPVTDGERVYVYWGSIGLLAALDMNGRIAWQTELGTYRTNQGWGTAASPLLYKGVLYVVNDNAEQSFIAAFDTGSGRELWRTRRDDLETYSTPVIWENELRTEIVTQSRLKFRSYDLAGTLLWQMPAIGRSPIATPVTSAGLVYLSSGYPGNQSRPVYAVRPGGAGDISLKAGETSSPFIEWSDPTLASYQASALIYRDRLYTLLDNGLLLCHDARTGRVVYGRQRLAPDAGAFGASPWAYNGKIFLLSEEGDTFVVQAGEEFKVLGRNSLNEMTLATPAVAGGSLFIRTQSKLYRIGSSR